MFVFKNDLIIVVYFVQLVVFRGRGFCSQNILRPKGEGGGGQDNQSIKKVIERKICQQFKSVFGMEGRGGTKIFLFVLDSF